MSQPKLKESGYLEAYSNSDRQNIEKPKIVNKAKGKSAKMKIDIAKTFEYEPEDNQPQNMADLLTSCYPM